MPDPHPIIPETTDSPRQSGRTRHLLVVGVYPIQRIVLATVGASGYYGNSAPSLTVSSGHRASDVFFACGYGRTYIGLHGLMGSDGSIAWTELWRGKGIRLTDRDAIDATAARHANTIRSLTRHYRARLRSGTYALQGKRDPLRIG